VAAPLWVKQMLMESGRMTSRGTTRKAQVRRCGGCGRVILSGLDGDVLAFDVDVDPTPLSEAGEEATVASGRVSYGLSTVGRPDLNWRGRWHVGKPAGFGRVVLAQHVCGEPVPRGWRAPPAPERVVTSSDTPEF
jgi:hypothetical protein